MLGSHNVSRWMTWLPISLKNAAKCDKWYQLQNLSITEFLNAKGAREKLFTSHPRAYRHYSVSKHQERTKFQNLFWNLSVRMQIFFADGVFLFLEFPCHASVVSLSNGRLEKQTKKEPKNSFLTFFTDMSAVGLPAELKHITQRRKRKQPWFP